MAKLTPELREVVLVRIARGSTYEDAADWLQSEHGIAISKQAIGKLVNKTRAERSEVSKAVARSHIAKQLPADLVAADEKHAQAARLLDLAARDAEAEPSVSNFEKYAKASAAYLKFEEMKRKTLGLDQPDDTFLDNIVDLAGLALAEEDRDAREAAFAPDDAEA